MEFLYCPKCGNKILANSQFCLYCGTELPHIKAINPSNSSSVYDTTLTNFAGTYTRANNWERVDARHISKKNIDYTFIVIVCFLVCAFISLIIPIAIYLNGSMTTESYMKEQSKEELTPYNAYNGQIFHKPSYKCLCPLTVYVPEGPDYYMELIFVGESPTSKRDRSRTENENQSRDDMAFYLKGGTTVEVDVPVGVYKVYYASGDTFYGVSYLFGDETIYHDPDITLDFAFDGQYYNGYNAEMDRETDEAFLEDQIPEEQFPKELN